MPLTYCVKRGAAHVPAERVRLCMSVGHQAFEGESLRALLMWCRVNSKSHDLILADSLQRFNLLPELSEELAMRNCFTAGDEWIERNSPILDTMGFSGALSRWEDWRQSETFRNAIEEVRCLFETMEPFREAVYRDAERYVARRQRASSSTLLPVHGIDYIVEEVAFSEAYERQRGAVEVYPGGEPGAVRIFRRLDELSGFRLASLRKVELASATLMSGDMEVECSPP